MRIGVDGSCWRNNRGFGRFTRELLSEMFRRDSRNTYVFFTDDQLTVAEFGSNVECVEIDARRKVIDSATANDRRSAADILAFRSAAARAELDVLFYPTVYSWFPPPPGVPSAVTFHDAIAERFPELVFPKLPQRLAWNAKTWLAKHAARTVITVSHAAKDEIVRYLGIPAGKIEVICEGAGGAFHPVSDESSRKAVRTKLHLPADRRFLVYVGGFAPHKNLERLLDAFVLAAERDDASDLALVMIGDPKGGGFHSIYEALQAKAAAHPALKGRVHFTGYVSDEDLAALYSDALALVLPSLSEGFGLPALEAMSCGAPVLGSEGGAVMEVAAAAGLSFDPLSTESIAGAITAIARDAGLEASLRRHAIPETSRNSWPRAADLALRALERCAGAQ